MKIIIYTVDNLKKNNIEWGSFPCISTQNIPHTNSTRKKTTSRQRIVWGISCVIVRKEVMSLKEEGTMLL